MTYWFLIYWIGNDWNLYWAKLIISMPFLKGFNSDPYNHKGNDF